MENPLFILDVGTRKVAGLLVRYHEGKASILAQCVQEHPERAMLDGQVHDISKAAQVVGRVRAELEMQAGIQLKAAHIAVAGRSLFTQPGKATAVFEAGQAIDAQKIQALELQAIREAKLALADAKAAVGAYCVGYCPLYYSLDGVRLGSLVGQRGAQAEVSVLATFLPKLVLDSLSAVLRLAGLSMASLTLEPIAALSIAVPGDLRRLNLALVDVGAGTSDIALTRNGSVSAFAMVPLAGDEVTERLCDQFLIDFEQAEILKRRTQKGQNAQIMDLFGKPQLVEREKVLDAILPAAAEIAREVAAKILELNGGSAPQAVLLVGGGSLTPALDRLLAEALGIPASRVGHRPPSLQRLFENLPEELQEVWAITPLGIAQVAVENKGLPFAEFKVNGQPVQVLQFQQRFSAFDVLLAAGKEVRQFFGRPGLGLSYSINGKQGLLKGGLGSQAKLLAGEEEISFDAEVQAGAELLFMEGQVGSNAVARVGEILEKEGLGPIVVFLNGARHELQGELLLNGKPASLMDFVSDGGKLQLKAGWTVGQLLEKAGVSLRSLESRSIAVTLNGEPKSLRQSNYYLKVNGREASLDQALQSGDGVEFKANQAVKQRVRDILPESVPARRKLSINGHSMELSLVNSVWMNGSVVSPDEFLIDGADIRVSPDGELTLSKVLPQLSLDLASLQARGLSMRVNGQPAQLNTPLPEGAQILLDFEA